VVARRRDLAFTTLVHPDRGLETGAPSQADDDPYVRFNRDVLVVTKTRWKSDALGLVGDYVRQLALVAADGGDRRGCSRGAPRRLVPRLVARRRTWRSPATSSRGAIRSGARRSTC
jgi:hypothetical protein